MNSSEKEVAQSIFLIIERVLLIIVVLMTIGGVAFEMRSLWAAQAISLADILLMFLYLEVIGMAPENILYEAIAILILASAAYVITRLNLLIRGDSPF